MKNYNPKELEPKWQKFWEKKKLNMSKDFSKKEKNYLLVEFPYPSGEGLHVGHCRSYSAIDVIARKKRLEGFNVLFPIGWDAFGLPTENYALRTGIHPQTATEKNIANFKRQLKSLGLSFDWSREINTTDPKYYKWTQLIFLQLFNQGLAYEAEIPVNWCPSCKIGLANEEVVDGKCERCHTSVVQKILKQWMIKITKYADRLIEDLKSVDYLEKIKIQQIEWIGRSEGTEVKFSIFTVAKGNSPEGHFQFSINVFTTRVDTIFGVTAIVLAPEHKLISKLKYDPAGSRLRRQQILNISEVENYIKNAKDKNEFERTKLEKEKTGVPLTGVFAINPVNNEKVPIWVGDYVAGTYGGGAVMVVPAHDKRDFEFAIKYNLPIRQVVTPINADKNVDLRRLKEAFVDYGKLVNSKEFDGLSSKEAIKKITQWLEEKRVGSKSVHYKLRDWVFSRQHYWGEPIPLIFCERCKKQAEISNLKSDPVGSRLRRQQISKTKEKFNEGELLNPGWVAVPEKDLPVKLPYIEKYQPTGTGESPLAAIDNWINTVCPKCGGPAKRETDTMPNWAGSNWYFMRYCDPKNEKELTDPKKLKYWMPVDWYNGGMEHTTLHLLYSRFIYKFLYDIGIVPQPEPYKKRTSHGIILAEDGRKMSKSFGNVINPDEIVGKYGADTLRVYEMFMGPFDQAIAWSSQGVKGIYRFLNRIWKLVLECKNNPEGVDLRRPYGASKKSSQTAIKNIHRLNKKVNDDLEKMKFNTAVSSFMEFVNYASDNKKEIGKDILKRLLLLLAPFAPHISEELWCQLNNISANPRNHQCVSASIFQEKWPKYDPKMIEEEKFILIIQINGKIRDKMEIAKNISKEEIKKISLEREKIEKWLVGKEIKKIIFVPNKLINIVA